MKNKQLLTLCLLLGILSASCSKFTVTKISHEKDKKSTDLGSGFAYVLPKVALTIQIPVRTKVYEKGICFDTKTNDLEIEALRKKFKNDVTKYSIINDNVIFLTKALPDFEKYYFVSFNNHLAKDQSFVGKLNNVGFLTESSFKQTDYTVELLTQIVGSVKNVASAFKSSIDTDYCEDVKSQLTEIRANKLKLISGTAGNTIIPSSVSEASFDKQLALLNEAERDLMSKLTFSTSSEDALLSLDIDPKKITEIEIPFFYFDKGILHINKNIIDENTLKNKGDKIKLEDVSTEITKQAHQYYLKLLPFDTFEEVVYENRNVATNGFAYNVPSSRRLLLINKEKDGNDVTSDNILNEIVQIPQLGGVGYLGTNLAKVSFTLDPVSGSLTTVDVESKSVLSKSKIEDIETTLSKFKKEAKEPEETDEQKQEKATKKKIDDLTSKKTILTLEQEIKELEKKK